MYVCLLRRGGRLEKLRPASARTACAGLHRRRSPVTVARPRGGARRCSPTRYALSMTDRVHKSDADWRAELTPEQYEVLRRKGTERAFTGALQRPQGRRLLPLRRLRRRAVQLRRRSSTPAPAGRASGRRPTPTRSPPRRTAASSCAAPRSSARAATAISATCSTTARDADRAALLHQLRRADVRARRRVSGRAAAAPRFAPAARAGAARDVTAGAGARATGARAGQRAGVALNMIASVDGRIAIDGRSGPLGEPRRPRPLPRAARARRRRDGRRRHGPHRALRPDHPRRRGRASAAAPRASSRSRSP